MIVSWTGTILFMWYMGKIYKGLWKITSKCIDCDWHRVTGRKRREKKCRHAKCSSFMHGSFNAYCMRIVVEWVPQRGVIFFPLVLWHALAKAGSLGECLPTRNWYFMGIFAVVCGLKLASIWIGSIFNVWLSFRY